MKTLVVAFLFALITQTLSSQDLELKIGDKAPTFKAIDDQGKKWNSDGVVGEKVLVVYFYPAAMTGGCTKQACAYRDNKEKLSDLGIEVVGISGDEVVNLKYFKMAHDLNFPLLSDLEGKIAKQFGVPTKDGGEITREVDGEEKKLKRNVTTSRWTFAIGKDGKIIYKNTEVNAAEDTEHVLKAIQAYVN
jgi:peroxiredoxin Q/BCP